VTSRLPYFLDNRLADDGEKIEFLPQRTHCASVTKTNQLMLDREIIALYSENHTRNINSHCEPNAEFLNANRKTGLRSEQNVN
jgi:hypothetical protein